MFVAYPGMESEARHTQRDSNPFRDLMNGHVAGRPAVAFWRHEPEADQQASTLAEAALRFHRQVGGDLLKLTPAGTYQAAALGLLDQWQGDPLGRRTITSRPITEPRHWTLLPAGGTGRQEEHYLEALARSRRGLDTDVCLLATVFSPMTQALQLAGAAALAAHAGGDLAALQHGLECLAQRTPRRALCCRQPGPDGIYYVAQHYQPGLLPPALRALAVEIDSVVMESCPVAAGNLLHLHGSSLGGPLPGAPAGWALHFESCVDNQALEDAANLAGRPRVLGLPVEQIRRISDPRQCRAVVRSRACAHAGTGALVTTGCVLPMDLPLPQARRWVEAIRAWA